MNENVILAGELRRRGFGADEIADGTPVTPLR